MQCGWDGDQGDDAEGEGKRADADDEIWSCGSATSPSMLLDTHHRVLQIIYSLARQECVIILYVAPRPAEFSQKNHLAAAERNYAMRGGPSCVDSVRGAVSSATSLDIKDDESSSDEEQGGRDDAVPVGPPATIMERVHRYALTKLRSMSRDDLDHDTVSNFARVIERDLQVDLIPDERTLVRKLFLEYSVSEVGGSTRSHQQLLQCVADPRRRKGSRSRSTLSHARRDERRRSSIISSARARTLPSAIIAGRRRSVHSSAAVCIAAGLEKSEGEGGRGTFRGDAAHAPGDESDVLSSPVITTCVAVKDHNQKGLWAPAARQLRFRTGDSIELLSIAPRTVAFRPSEAPTGPTWFGRNVATGAVGRFPRESVQKPMFWTRPGAARVSRYELAVLGGRAPRGFRRVAIVNVSDESRDESSALFRLQVDMIDGRSYIVLRPYADFRSVLAAAQSAAWPEMRGYKFPKARALFALRDTVGGKRFALQMFSTEP